MSTPFKTTVGLRGRVTVPSAIQAEAGIGVGDTVVVRVAGPGVITIETMQAVKDRIRSGIPDGKEENGSEDDRAAQG